MENDQLAILWEQYLAGRMSKAERESFQSLMQDPVNQEFFEALLGDSMQNPDVLLQTDRKKEQHIQQVMNTIHPGSVPTLYRSPNPGRNWLRYAAAASLVLCVGAYFLFRPATSDELAQASSSAPAKLIQPGGDRARLTLADGTEVLLDSAINGSIAMQGNTEIMKNADGQIVYGSNGSKDATTMMNTMSTPVGGKYQLTLPDGTRVWLNAASSITFPVAFPQQERTVKITGEVYFEVAPDKARAFSVTGGRAKVQVLGTRFNMNAYDDESSLKVTLLNGSVKVSDIASQKATVLNPGQQAQLNAESLIINNNADISKVMAWKNDLFNFEDVNLDEAMRQLSRWYGVKVTYQNGSSKTQLWGKMSRNTSFERVLRNLKDIGVNFKLTDNRELIILP